MLLLIGGFMLSALLVQGAASASILTDLPGTFANALGTSDYVAGMILSAGIILSVLLPLGLVRRLPPVIIMGVLLTVCSVLTAIGWLDKLVLIMTAIVVAISLGATVKGWVD